MSDIVNYDLINYEENEIINKRLPSIIKSFFEKIKKHIPNIQIYLYGSITNFTYFKNSDTDSYIIYPDEYTKYKLIKLVSDNSEYFNIKCIILKKIKASKPNYKDEYVDLLRIILDDGSIHQLEISLYHNNIGPIAKSSKGSTHGRIHWYLLFIVKYLYYELNIISKNVYSYIKKKILRYTFNDNTTVLSQSIIKDCKYWNQWNNLDKSGLYKSNYY
jgi:predicted nucleotidyltransferase